MASPLPTGFQPVGRFSTGFCYTRTAINEPRERFASVGEFPALAAKAASEGMSPDAIKRAVKNWKVDSDRM